MTTDKVIAEILAGRHDGKLLDIVKAVAKRGESGETGLLWRIDLDGDIWDAETVTLGELRYVEQVTGLSWFQLDPKKYMLHFAALVTAHYKAQGLDHEAALAKADGISQTQALKAIDLYEASLGKDESASTTS